MTDRPALRRNLIFILVAAAALLLAANGRVSLWDRDEPRYAQTSRQMLQGGDWVVPRLYDQVRTAKPIFIYWCQAGAMKLLGDDAFAARLPSAVGLTLALVIVAAAIWRGVDPRRAVWTTFILATSALSIIVGKMSTTDAVLLPWIMIAQFGLYALWRGHATWPVMLSMAVAIGLAGLTKGPVVLGVMGMTLLVLAGLRWWDRRRGMKQLKTGGFDVLPPSVLRGRAGEGAANESRSENAPAFHPSAPTQPSPVEAREGTKGQPSTGTCIAMAVVGLLITTAIVGPWLYLVQQRASDFLGTTVSHDVFGRIVRPLEGHRGPPGYHLFTVFATFLPWSLLLPFALVSGWRRRHVPAVRFALAAAVGPWLMFEIVQTKLPHYLLPIFPALAFLVADAAIASWEENRNDLARPGFVRAVGVWAVLMALLGSAPWLAAIKFRDLPWGVMAALSLLAIVYAVVVFQRFWNGRQQSGMIAMGVGFFIVMAAVYNLYLPRAQFLRLSINAAEILKEHGVTQPDQVVMLDYKEPSLAFCQGGTIREHRAERLTAEVLAGAPPWLVITDRVWKNSSPEAQSAVMEIGRAHGLAYADRGRVLDVIVVKKR